MAGFGHAPENPPVMVGFDFWAMEKGLVTEAFVRNWLGSYWSVVGSLATLTAFAIAVAVPDTMELVDYREGEPRSNWRKTGSPLRWSPSPGWALAVLALFAVAFANLGSFSEFLYYQF
jgi:hypothetical protein